MRRIFILARRELSAYFFSPMAYVVSALFLGLVGVIFLWGMRITFLRVELEPVFRSGADSTLRPLFNVLAYSLVVVIPLLTMRLVAEENRSGTLETLMTAPVTDAQVIIGKFLGALGLYVLLLAATVVYFLLIVAYGQPDWGVAAMGYLGMLLLGATYISVGLFASTLTRYQLVAGLIGIAILTFFTAGLYLLVMALPAGTGAVLSKANMITNFADFSRGVFDTRGVVFFVSMTLFFLFISTKVLESRRWR